MEETQEGQEDPLEEEMATQASSLAWKIPWTEEHGGLPCGYKVIHDWETEHQDLLYNIGSSTQYSVMTYMGEEWIYVYV